MDGVRALNELCRGELVCEIYIYGSVIKYVCVVKIFVRRVKCYSIMETQKKKKGRENQGNGRLFQKVRKRGGLMYFSVILLLPTLGGRERELRTTNQ